MHHKTNALRKVLMRGPHRLLLLASVTAFSLSIGRCTPGASGNDTCVQLASNVPHVRIDRIVIEVHDIIQPGDPAASWIPAAAVNALHIKTSKEIIRRELLFKEGDVLDPDRIEEARRNLRALGYFRDESIECRLSEPESDRAVVLVHLKETWSLVPLFGMRGVGGRHAITGGLAERNLMGLGKTLSAAYRSGLDYQNVVVDEAWMVSYSDPNIMGSRLQCSTTLQKLHSGEYVAGLIQRPFYALHTTWAASMAASHQKRRLPLVLNGIRSAEYDRQDNEARIFAAWALTPGSRTIHRVGGLYTYRQKRITDFTVLATLPDGSLPQDPEGYTMSGPGLSYRRLGVNYIREKRIDTFDRTEDFNIANDLAITASASLKSLGASANECVITFSNSQGHRFREGHLILAKVSGQGRWDGSNVHDTKIVLKADYFLRTTRLDTRFFSHTLHVDSTIGYGVNLSSDTLFALGWETGLRGYTSAQFTGNKIFLASCEDRILATRDLFGIIAIGVVPFWDAGYVWKEGKDVALSDITHDLGVGIRIGLPMCAGENILRIDVGFPVPTRSSTRPYTITVVTSTTL